MTGIVGFYKPDTDKLVYEALFSGGICPFCMNAANEVLVNRLNKKIVGIVLVKNHKL